MAKPVLSDLDFGNVSKITNLPTPGSSGEASTKGYVDSAIAAAVNLLAWKDAVRVASTVNVTVASPGTSIDGVTLTNGDRVLLKDQSTDSQNGIYLWNGAASPMTRATDFDATAEIDGAVVPVEEGTSNTGTRWYLATIDPTIGGSLSFSNMMAATPNASTTVDGLAQLATQGEVNSGAASPSNLVVTPETLNAWSMKKLIASGTVGDGAATQFDITHNLNTKNLLVQCFRVSDDKMVEVEATAFSVNITRLNFAEAPSSNAIRYVIVG